MSAVPPHKATALEAHFDVASNVLEALEYLPPSMVVCSLSVDADEMHLE